MKNWGFLGFISRLSCLTHVGPSFHSCPPFVSRREPDRTLAGTNGGRGKGEHTTKGPTWQQNQAKALDQERLHFTLVGLFAGFTIAASCARAAPGSPEKKQAFSKSNRQIQTPSLSQRSQSLIKPLLRNSFSTIFQGPGPGEAPFHFSRFVRWVHYCSKLCQSSSWKPRREASLFQKQLPNSNSKPFPKEPIPY